MKRRRKRCKSSREKRIEAIKALLSASPRYVLNYSAIYKDFRKALRVLRPSRVLAKRTGQINPH